MNGYRRGSERPHRRRRLPGIHPELFRPLIARLAARSARTGRPVTIVSDTEPGSRGNSPPGVDEIAIAEDRRIGLATRVLPADW